MNTTNIKFNVIPINRNSIDDFDYKNVIFQIQAGNVLDTGHDPEMWFFLKTIMNCGAVKFILDMSELDFLDSLGIALIIRFTKTARKLGGDVVLLEVPENIDNIFKPIGFNRFMKIYDERTEALQYLRFVH